MAPFTPIKVRGKRSATRDEKWLSGKRHRNGLNTASTVSEDNSCSWTPVGTINAAEPRKRRRRQVRLSRLEELPTEIVQAIFDYSANINLALTSPALKNQLRSQHLHVLLTSRILGSVLHCDGEHGGSGTDLAMATRLLGCKFMTWDFFKAWLDQQSAGVHRITDHYLTAWSDLKPSPQLLPPLKLLRAPWTVERTSFLRVFSREISDLAALSSTHHETAVNGMAQAVAETARDAVGTLLSMGVKATTELLRQAVIDFSCDKDIVIALLSPSVNNDGTVDAHSSLVNLLDPALWAWSERARRDGNDKGDWLLRLLKSKAADNSISNIRMQEAEGDAERA